MIDIKIMDICGNCPCFEPKKQEIVDYEDRGAVAREITISCENEYICQRAIKETVKKIHHETQGSRVATNGESTVFQEAEYS